MRILYCRIGLMNSYKGILNDSIQNGGSYNKNNIGHEIYNFDRYNGTYYGFVQSKSNSININRIEDNISDEEYIDNVLVVWIATKETGGQYVVGWYKNAVVYRNMQYIPQEIISTRVKSKGSDYNEYLITSKEATLVVPSKRSERINGMGEANVWYGNEEINNKVINYINNFEKQHNEEINAIMNFKRIEGKEKEVIIKARVNQSFFRKLMLKKFEGKCCLCNMGNKDLLIASHIKPWNKSDSNEKLNEFNGLLLCPNHDSVFDKGLISFEDNGNILISNNLKELDKILLNVNNSMKINITVDNIDFIRYHRNYIFQSNKKDI